MRTMYGYCDYQAKRLKSLIEDMEMSHPIDKKEIRKTANKQLRFLHELCRQNDVDFKKILEQNNMNWKNEK